MQADALSRFPKTMSQTKKTIDRCKYYALFNFSKLLRNTLSLKRTPLQSALKVSVKERLQSLRDLKALRSPLQKLSLMVLRYGRKTMVSYITRENYTSPTI